MSPISTLSQSKTSDERTPNTKEYTKASDITTSEKGKQIVENLPLVLLTEQKQKLSPTTSEQKITEDQKTQAVVLLQLLQKDPEKSKQALAILGPDASNLPLQEICVTLTNALEKEGRLENLEEKFAKMEEQQRDILKKLGVMESENERLVERIALNAQRRTPPNSSTIRDSSFGGKIWKIISNGSTWIEKVVFPILHVMSLVQSLKP